MTVIIITNGYKSNRNYALVLIALISASVFLVLLLNTTTAGNFTFSSKSSDFHIQVFREPTWELLNHSFTTNSKYAISTLVTNGHYITGMQTLAYAVSKWKRNDTDLLALVLKQASLSEVQTAALKFVGWKLLEVPLIPQPRPTHHYKDQFTKLWLWNMTEYRLIIYMDGDYIPLKSMNDIIAALDNDGIRFAASRDWGKLKSKTNASLPAKNRNWHSSATGFWDSFNAGFFVLRPSNTEFVRFMKLLKENQIDYNTGKSEQGWLNVVYRDTWFELSFFNNVLAAVNFFNKPFWTMLKAYIRGLHMTHKKPFSELWGLDNEVNQIYYKWYREMIATWGDTQPFTIVLPVCISKKSLEADFRLFDEIQQPLVVYNVCPNEELGTKISSLALKTRKKVVFAKPNPDYCKYLGQKHPVSEVFEHCSPQIMTHVMQYNPFLTLYTLWIRYKDKETTLAAIKLAQSVKNLTTNSTKIEITHPWALDYFTLGVSQRSLAEKTSRDAGDSYVTFYGGTRATLLYAWKIHDRSYKCMNSFSKTLFALFRNRNSVLNKENLHAFTTTLEHQKGLDLCRVPKNATTSTNVNENSAQKLIISGNITGLF